VPVPWPGWNTGAWFQEAAKPQTVGSERYWLGSLSVEMRDASGLMYKRNRYYNPQTAHFTQIPYAASPVAASMMRHPQSRGHLHACLARALYRLQMAVVRTRRDNVRKRELHAGKPFTFGDFTIIHEPGAATRASVDRVAEALALIHDVHPRLFRRIRRDMTQLYIRKGAGAQYWSRLHTCVLSADQVASGQAHEIALKIVHEATHARLLKAGVPWLPDLFDRVERRCIREEISFCKHLSEHGYSVAQRVSWYEKRLQQPIYTRKALRAWRLRDSQARGADVQD
jgi:hypothetical protein